MSYQALVTPIFTRPLEGSDNIQLGNAAGYTVIVGKNIADGELGIFFEAGGQLSEEYAQQNDLVRRKNEEGTPAGGFFEENRRVKAIKLRGAISEGYWAPLGSVAYTGVDLGGFSQGDRFETLAGRPICQKYVTPATATQGKGRTQRKANPMFAKHVETGALRQLIQMIPHGAVIYITEKLHGTSARLGRVLDEIPIKRNPFMAWVAKLLKWPETTREWTHLNGTRNTVLGKFQGESFYGNEGFRHFAVKGIALRKGEVIYGEIVGDTLDGAPIMAPQDVSKLKDKRLAKQFGERMVYRYGTAPSNCALYIYRITHVNEDGDATELSWNQVVARCRELGLKTVPHLDATICDEKLLAIATSHVEDEHGNPYPSTLDPTHIREGVVVRHESSEGTGWLKHKGKVFGILEGYLKDDSEYVDTEESS